MYDWINPRGLCLNPPYGSCIAACETQPELGKHIETRGYWPHTFNGTLFIHQTKGLGEMFDDEADLADHCALWPFCDALEALGYARADQLPRGKIVAVANIREVMRIDSIGVPGQGEGYVMFGRSLLTRQRVSHHISERERAFGYYEADRVLIFLADIRALPEPVVCRGMQGLWVPDAATIARVREQVAG